MVCPVHGNLLIHADPTKPQPQLYRVVERIAARAQPDVRDAFLQAVEKLRDQIDMDALADAVRARDITAIETALRVDTLRPLLAEQAGVQAMFRRLYAAVGEASAQVLSDVLGVDWSFEARDPNAILYARSQSSTLVTKITDDQRLSIQAIIGRGQAEGLTIEAQAVEIHKVVGIRHDWVGAPMNLARELRGGDEAAALSRRLDAATKARIRSRIRAGTVDDAFIGDVTDKYAHSLRRRRALDIARTETIDSSNAGLQSSWSDAQRRGVLPETARRFWIPHTERHLPIVEANPEGVGIDEPFKTEEGEVMHPPAGPNCGCGVGLLVPGLEGRL